MRTQCYKEATAATIAVYYTNRVGGDKVQSSYKPTMFVVNNELIFSCFLRLSPPSVVVEPDFPAFNTLRFNVNISFLQLFLDMRNFIINFIFSRISIMKRFFSFFFFNLNHIVINLY